MDDTAAWFPEPYSIFGSRGGKEVIDLLVVLLGSLEVFTGP